MTGNIKHLANQIDYKKFYKKKKRKRNKKHKKKRNFYKKKYKEWNLMLYI